MYQRQRATLLISVAMGMQFFCYSEVLSGKVLKMVGQYKGSLVLGVHMGEIF